MIQETSRGTESREGKTSKSRRSQRMESRKILNKRKVRGVVKYLVLWKRFTAEHDSWEREKDL